MALTYFINSSGEYLGAFDGGSNSGTYWNGTAWVSPPSGITAVASQPSAPGQTWNGTAWVDTPASLSFEAQATYNSLIAGGLAITSTGTSSINGTYDVSIAGQDNMVAMQTAIAVNSALFPGFWRTISGTKITMTAAQFTEIATAALNFVVACDNALDTIQTGGTASWPSASVTIA